MCSRVHLLANPSSPRLSPGGTNLFIADGLTYVVPVFIRSARVFAMASAVSSALWAFTTWVRSSIQLRS